MKSFVKIFINKTIHLLNYTIITNIYNYYLYIKSKHESKEELDG